MAHFFSYLNSPEAQAPSAAPRITHQEEGREAGDTALADEEFDETADADLGGNNTGEEGEQPVQQQQSPCMLGSPSTSSAPNKSPEAQN